RKVILGNGGNHGRLLSAIQCGAGIATSSIHEIVESADLSHRLFNTFKLTDINSKLTTDRRISSNYPSGHLGTARTLSGQRNTTSHTQRLHQHTPAVTGLFGTTNNLINRYDHVFSINGAIIERYAQRIVSTTQDNTVRIAWDKCTSNAQMLAFAQMVFRIFELKSQSNDG